MRPLSGSRDGSDLETFVEREHDRLLRLAIALTGNRIDADDLLQETLARLITSWRKVDASANPTAYVRAMMTNTFITGKRRKASTEAVSDAVVQARAGSVDDTEAFIVRHDLLRSVAALPRRQRAVIVLRYFEDMTVAEVAAALRMREGAVRATAHRAMTALRADTTHSANVEVANLPASVGASP